jgi:PAS domain S-box-containing protein
MSTAAEAIIDASRDALIRRTGILHAINRLAGENLSNQSRNDLLTACGEIILEFSAFEGVWVGRFVPDTALVAPLTYLHSLREGDEERRIDEHQILLDPSFSDPIDQALAVRRSVIKRDIEPPINISPLPRQSRYRSYGIWPLVHHNNVYGVVVIFSDYKDGFPGRETELLDATITDLSLLLYTHDVAVQLQFERDFNKEIIDTIQALMVSITPCGKIVHFNSEAERVTGYKRWEVLDRYWVDVLLSPDNRLHYQNVVSRLLKSDAKHPSFRASLQTRNGDTRTIDWHSSIKQDIDHGTVGMVLFGLDITDRLAADRRYDSAVAKWENIYEAIQDPALIATRDGVIIDANHATFTAARKSRAEVIGKKVCDILHGGKDAESACPLEELIKSGKSRILNTELGGLHGEYLLTISPLKRTAGMDEAALLVARDMTEEERHKAEAIRAAQLASIGELAAGVAHEINNPINGILNYAQMLDDLNLDSRGEEIIGRIIAEGKRIAKIVRNLLNFSRHKVEEPVPVDSGELLNDCLELVMHQLNNDNIVLELFLEDDLPLVYCNPSQIQQVMLNVISNSRYALNQRYASADSKKKLVFNSSLVHHGTAPYIRYSITDFGTGIEHQLLERVFDPFFSTKPNGEGTGLGLSISYGLVRENGGIMRINSLYNSYTTITIDLPAAGLREENR